MIPVHIKYLTAVFVHVKMQTSGQIKNGLYGFNRQLSCIKYADPNVALEKARLQRTECSLAHIDDLKPDS